MDGEEVLAVSTIVGGDTTVEFRLPAIFKSAKWLMSDKIMGPFRRERAG